MSYPFVLLSFEGYGMEIVECKSDVEQEANCFLPEYSLGGTRSFYSRGPSCHPIKFTHKGCYTTYVLISRSVQFYSPFKVVYVIFIEFLVNILLTLLYFRGLSFQSRKVM